MRLYTGLSPTISQIFQPFHSLECLPSHLNKRAPACLVLPSSNAFGNESTLDNKGEEVSFPLNAWASMRCILSNTLSNTLSDTYGLEPAEHRSAFP